MKVLFLGGVFIKEMEKEILKNSKGVIQYAANKFQYGIIDGLMTIEDITLDVLSAPFICPYPIEYKNLRINNYSSVYRNKININSVGFNNLWGYRNISRTKSLKKVIKSFTEEKNENKIIIIYSSHTPFLEAAIFAKKTDPTIHICLIVPDLPCFMNLNKKQSIVYKVFKKIDTSIFYNGLKYIDSFVLITKQMKDQLGIGDRPFIVIEGIVNSENIQKTKGSNLKGEKRNPSIVYTGTLNKKYGIENLLHAFSMIENKNAQLIICGRGDSEGYVKEHSDNDSRVKYLGQLTNEEAEKIQKSATVLVNPRQNNEEFTKYSFPFKNMEYLLSGRPVVAYKLDGIPDEYDRYFFYVEDNSINSLTKTMDKVLNLTEKERTEFGLKAQEFVSKEKNCRKAGEKIVDMLKRASNTNSCK